MGPNDLQDGGCMLTATTLFGISAETRTDSQDHSDTPELWQIPRHVEMQTHWLHIDSAELSEYFAFVQIICILIQMQPAGICADKLAVCSCLITWQDKTTDCYPAECMHTMQSMLTCMSFFGTSLDGSNRINTILLLSILTPCSDQY